MTIGLNFIDKSKFSFHTDLFLVMSSNLQGFTVFLIDICRVCLMQCRWASICLL